MKNKTYLIIGIAMIIAAFCFIVYALNNPQAGFPWSNSITYTIYLAYIVIIILFIKKALKK